MGKKDRSASYARDQMAHLTHLCIRMQRCRKESLEGLLQQAEQTLRRFRMAKFVGDEIPVDMLKDVLPEDLNEPLSVMGEVIRDTFRPHAYALFVFGKGQADKPGAHMGYVTNAQLPDLAQVMREFVVAADAAEDSPK